MAVNGGALGAVAAGTVALYAGIKGYSIPQVIQSVVSGKSPAGLRQSAGIQSPAAAAATASTGTPVQGGSDSQNKALGQQLAAAYGWGSGAQWTALNNIVMAESGWSDTVTNAGSGAAGIAQNISGWSDSYQKGNAPQQIAWLLSYIQQRYGTPQQAWAFHLANGWY